MLFSSALERTFSRTPLKATMRVSLPMGRLVSHCRVGVEVRKSKLPVTPITCLIDLALETRSIDANLT